MGDRIVVMAPRPGRVVAEIAVPTPLPRDEDYRLGPDYAEMCRQTSQALHRAMNADAALTALACACVALLIAQAVRKLLRKRR